MYFSKLKKSSNRNRKKPSVKKTEKIERSLTIPENNDEIWTSKIVNKPHFEEESVHEFSGLKRIQKLINIQKLLGPSLPGTSIVPIHRPSISIMLQAKRESAFSSSEVSLFSDQIPIIEALENVQLVLLNQYPGVSTFFYFRNHKSKNQFLTEVGIVLTKPFSTEKIEEMRVKFNFGEVEIIPVHCGLCDVVFSEADIQLVDLLRHECVIEKNKLSATILYKCALCNKQDEKKDTIRKHIFSHILSNDLFCLSCCKKKYQYQSDISKKVLSQVMSVLDHQPYSPISCKFPSFLYCQHCNITLCNWKTFFKNIKN
ncbi:uncharacterized protein LOC111619339 [Centruroides sculpturatus]|uniref:uncharacterized protein LOC111619339 n=1 Tax=Centruroides sculpturatus TaxID=218467 RepID=UPI000C6CABB5|nr:uncharacterized protein LOC111619339 [Centruroides sculpturatus]